MKTNRERLQELSLHITKKICNVNCFVTKQEADAKERLEKIVGEKWDAINERWIALED